MKWDTLEKVGGGWTGFAGRLAHWWDVNTGSSDTAVGVERKLGSRAVAKGCGIEDCTKNCSLRQQLALEIWPAGVSTLADRGAQ